MSTVSIRPLVLEGASRFAELFGGRATDAGELLVELIIGMSSFQEEGFSYAPLVFVTTDLTEVLRSVQGNAPIFVGRGAHGSVSARAATASG